MKKMTKPKIHVAFLGKQKTTELFTIRRSIDELILVYSKNTLGLAEDLVEKFSELGILVVAVAVEANCFNNVLSSILRSLNSRNLDDYQIEFSIASGHCVMTLAACVAAAIVKASVLCATGFESFQMSEIWPSELVNLTDKKRQILDYLEGFNHPVLQKEMSKDTDIRQSCLSRHLGDLERAGYISRSRIARYKHVKITELGSAILHHKQLRKRRVWDSHTSRTLEGIQVVG
jgi:DNA-binding MarR family transcriptional regulator